MDPNLHLMKDLGNALPNPTLYRELIGRLLYLTITRPDITFAAHQLSQFLSTPTDIHLQAAHKVLRYIKNNHGQGGHHLSWTETTQTLVPEREHNLPKSSKDSRISMAINKILFASLLICLLIQSSHGATKERLFSELEKGALEVTAKPSREGVVLEAGVDKLSITWKLSSTATKESEFKTIKVKLCYAPASQVDRPWRKTHDELFKDKSCPHKVVARPYDSTDKTTQSIEYTLERDIPTGTYFVRAYAVDANDHEVAFGQSTDVAKTINLFSVQAISGRHKSLDIASICFSVFSVLALLVFFVNEKRKAKLEQSK